MFKSFSALSVLVLIVSCGSSQNTASAPSHSNVADTLPAPDMNNPARKFSRVISWPENVTPVAPAGLTVTKYGSGFKSPRNIYTAPNGDVFVVLSNSQRTPKEQIENLASGKAFSEVAGKSVNTVVLLRDADHDGKPEIQSEYISGLDQPYGVLVLNNYFYVANTGSVWRYPYNATDLHLKSKGEKILGLPAGGYNNHWTRNLIASNDGSKIYVTVGSGSNVAEHGIEFEKRRANIIEINPDGSGERIYASGLRNPVGLGWAPGTNTLWTAVNERDELGDELVPDYLTSVKAGGFYGWPYAYFGAHEDPRRKGERPDLVSNTIIPDINAGSHTATLGLLFYTGSMLPAKYRNGLFAAQHGSWNRSSFSGYKIIFVPFKNGSPAGNPEDFITGFIADESKSLVYGRPVAITTMADGSILFTDDVSGIIWRIGK